MIKRIRKTVLMGGAVSMLIVLGACSSYDGKPLAQMTFEHIKPFPVYVASYEVVPYQSQQSRVQALPGGFVSDPAALLRDYFQNRFEAAGTTGKVRAIIDDVTVQHEMVESESKMGALLGVDHQDHYTIRAAVTLEALGTQNYEVRRITMDAHRELYISEHVSLAEREAQQMAALDKLIDEIDTTAQRVLKERFNLMR